MPHPSRRALLRLLLAAGLLRNRGLFAQRRARGGVEFLWSGGVTATAAEVKARASMEGAKCRILLAETSDFKDPKRSDEVTAEWKKNGRIVDGKFSGLKAATEYFYAVEVNGEVDTRRRGRFRTFSEGPWSFKLAFGSCASTGSESSVFNAIRENAPAVFMHIGDFHYENIGRDDPDEFRAAYDEVMSSTTQSELYRNVPIMYTWDDHDFGPNDCDRTNPAKRAAHKVYRETVPHYELGGGDETPIYQAFSIGRARVIVVDTRTERDPRRQARPSMLGEKQKRWLFDQLGDAAKKHPLVFLVQSVPWIAQTGKTGDGWAPYCDERREIAQRIDSLGLTRRLIMLSGDAHMLAMDDGRHSNYAADGCTYSRTEKGFPVFHAASFDRMGSTKGGPYAPRTPQPGRGHFGLVTVTDDGGETIRVQLSGRDKANREVMGLDLKMPASLE